MREAIQTIKRFNPVPTFQPHGSPMRATGSFDKASLRLRWVRQGFIRGASRWLAFGSTLVFG